MRKSTIFLNAKGKHRFTTFGAVARKMCNIIFTILSRDRLKQHNRRKNSIREILMLNDYGFNLWADSYDIFVEEADENNQYPFAGYTNLMNAIYGTIMHHSPAKVFDIGF